MRTILLSLCIISFSQALTINFTKSFDHELKPDTLQASLNITVKKSTEKEVIEKLSKYSSFIDSAKHVKKSGGNYNVRPEYLYENNKRYKSDYVGNIHYQIKSKESDQLNNFLKSIYDLKSDKNVDISTSSVNWIMSESQRSGKIDALRLDAILWGSKYVKRLSKSLSKKCSVSKVMFNSPGHFYPAPMMRSEVAMDKAAAPVPIQDTQKITINPSFELECK